MADNNVLIRADALTKLYERGSEKIAAVNGITLELHRGDFLAFVGPSGSGKTTLVNLIGCLDNPSAGSLAIDGKIVYDKKGGLSERGLTRIRRELFGYVFQKFYLIPTLTVRENVLLPHAFYRKPGTEKNADALLEMLGLAHRLKHLPGEISGGEMQRVAIARALVNDPEILLADEPTGNLDTERSAEIARVLGELNREKGLTVVLVTHNPSLAGVAKRTIELRDGKIAS